MADRRRSYTVDPKVRNFYFVTWGLSAGMLGLIGFMVWTYSQIGRPWEQFISPEGGALAKQLPLVIVASGAIMTLVSIVLAIYATVHIHRLHGAAYRIQMGLDGYQGDGRAFPINLRPDDFLLEMADQINTILEGARDSGGTPNNKFQPPDDDEQTKDEPKMVPENERHIADDEITNTDTDSE